MASTESNSYESEGYDADEWGQYRSLSTPAVVAFVLGLCSLITFVSPLMVVVPLAAVATALLALKGIAAADGGLSGARLARWGLALAIVFGVASFARVQVREMLLRRQADRIGRQWLSLAAEGHAEGMFELMTKSAADKLSPDVEPGQPMPFFGGLLASALLRQDPLVVELKQLKATGETSFQLSDAGIDAAGNPPQALLEYVTGHAGSEPQTCFLALKRFRASDREAIWLIDSWGLE